MRSVAYDRGLSARDEGGHSAPAFSPAESALRRLVRAIRLSPWAPVIGKVIVGIAALLALAALGNAALARPAVEKANPSIGALPPAKEQEPLEEPEAREALLARASTSPSQTEADCPKPSKSESSADSVSAVLPDGRIVLNLASAGELTKLPGIGPKRAEAILALRQRLGRFRRVEDLLRVKGIGRKMLERLRPAIVLDPPPSPKPIIDSS